jgi:hypothetical protein
VLRDEGADPNRRDRMAVAAAPYIHPRLSNVEARIVGDPENLIGLSVEKRVELARAAIYEPFSEVASPRVIPRGYLVISASDASLPHAIDLIGEPVGIRTRDLLIKSPILCFCLTY